MLRFAQHDRVKVDASLSLDMTGWRGMTGCGDFSLRSTRQKKAVAQRALPEGSPLFSPLGNRGMPLYRSSRQGRELY